MFEDYLDDAKENRLPILGFLVSVYHTLPMDPMYQIPC